MSTSGPRSRTWPCRRLPISNGAGSLGSSSRNRVTSSTDLQKKGIGFGNRSQRVGDECFFHPSLNTLVGSVRLHCWPLEHQRAMALIVTCTFRQVDRTDTANAFAVLGHLEG